MYLGAGKAECLNVYIVEAFGTQRKSMSEQEVKVEHRRPMLVERVTKVKVISRLWNGFDGSRETITIGGQELETTTTEERIQLHRKFKE